MYAGKKRMTIYLNLLNKQCITNDNLKPYQITPGDEIKMRAVPHIRKQDALLQEILVRVMATQTSCVEHRIEGSSSGQ